MSERSNQVIKAQDARNLELWTITHGFSVSMGGYTLQLVNGEQFCYLIERHPELLPSIIRKDVLDKSKADGVVESVTCCQIGRSFVQLNGRAVRGLEVTPLEFFTLSTVVCALASYGFWWHNPKDVSQPYIVPSSFASIPNAKTRSKLRQPLAPRHTLGQR